MKAALWYGERDIRIENVVEPIVQADQAMIEVEWCGICGSDLHEFVAGPITIPVEIPHPLTGDVAPIILGHEFSGRIVRIGEDVTNVNIGDRVTVEPILYCGKCISCTKGSYHLCDKRGFHGIVGNGGGFSKYTTVQAKMAHKIPKEMSYEAGALVEPAAVAVHAVRKSQIKLGDTCVVFGSGPIGLLLIQAALAAGASKIIAVEVSENRLQKALEVGATHMINPLNEDVVEKILSITNGYGADLCFEVSGAPSAFIQAVESVKANGEVMIVSLWETSISFNPNLLVLKECKLNAAVGYSHIYPEVISLISNGKIKTNSLITKKISLDEIVEEGFETLLKDKNHCKILVHPN